MELARKNQKITTNVMVKMENKIYICCNCNKQITGLYVKLPNIKGCLAITCIDCIRKNTFRTINNIHN
jgi:hypothetical protein